MFSKVKKIIKQKIARKVPVPYPVFEGKLLQGRCALITGGSSGIGYAIAESFVKNGASVIIVGRDKAKLDNSVKKLRKQNKDVVIKSLTFDLAKTSSFDKMLDNAIRLMGGGHMIDILVNNAGVLSQKTFGNAEADDFEKVMKTNAESVFFLSQSFYNYMKRNNIKGNILNVTSSSALRPAISAYTMSKWAIKSLTLGMAKKAIKDGIVVNAVAPGVTETPMMILDDSLNENISYNEAPIGRYIMPEEVANIATMLVSDLGRCVVGDTIYVTGGAGVITFDDMQY